MRLLIQPTRIRFHLRPVFLERVSESPGHRPSRTSPSIQAALLDSHIADFCPRGADFRDRGVLRSKARAARPSAGPRVPPPRRLARSRGAPLLLLARSCGVECGSPYPARACTSLAIYPREPVLCLLPAVPLARPALRGAVVRSQRHARAVFRSPPYRSLASRPQSPWRTTLNLLYPSSLSPQPKTLKRPPWDAAGASDASFQWESCLLLARLR